MPEEADAEREMLTNRRRLRHLRRREFTASDRVLALVEQEAAEWRGREQNDAHDRILLGLWARSFKTFRGALSLCGAGYGDQAAMLNRSLFEDMADIAWARANPSEAARNYDEAGRLDVLYSVAAASQHPQIGPVEPLTPEQEADLAHLKQRFGDFAQKNWTRLNLHRRLRAAERLWAEEDRRQVWAMHDIAHRRHNLFLHPSPWALERTFRGVQNGAGVFEAGPSDHWVAEGLFGAVWAIAMSTELILRHFGSPTADQFRAQMDEQQRLLRELTPEERATAERNATCPCGSGEKYKRCHAPG